MKKPLLGILISAIFAMAPLLLTALATLIADANGCRLHEGFTYPCEISGYDIGELLHRLGILFWFAFFTIPVGALACLGCIIWLAVIFFRQKKNK